MVGTSGCERRAHTKRGGWRLRLAWIMVEKALLLRGGSCLHIARVAYASVELGRVGV